MATAPRADNSLARCVPDDVRLYMELRDLGGILNTPGGAALARFFRQATSSAPAATSQPASQPATQRGWRNLIAEAIGLAPDQADTLLFSGRLAIAADGWSGLGDAVLVAEPKDMRAFEAGLADRRIGPVDEPPPRRYAMDNGHELACDDRNLVLGRRDMRSGLYGRCLNVIAGQRPGRAAERLVDENPFKDHFESLPQDAHVFFYVAAAGAEQPGAFPVPAWFPVIWPPVDTAGITVKFTPSAIVIDVHSRLAERPEVPRWDPAPNQRFLSLPSNTLLAWTQQIDYSDVFARATSGQGQALAQAWASLLLAGAPPEAVKRDFVDRLIGQTIIVVGSTAPQQGATQPSGRKMSWPAIACCVQTDSPIQVENLLSRLSTKASAQASTSSQSASASQPAETLARDDLPQVHQITLGRIVTGLPVPLLSALLQPSWAMDEEWLVLGSHPDLVRAIMVAAHAPATQPSGELPDRLERLATAGAIPKTILTGKPTAMGRLLSDCLEAVLKQYPIISDAEWWDKLRRQQQRDKMQLGILAHEEPSGLRVEKIVPNYPADQKLRPGDLLVAVDGHRLPKARPAEVMRDLITQRVRRDGIRITVIREGTEQDIDLILQAAGPDLPLVPSLALVHQLLDLMSRADELHLVTWEGRFRRLDAQMTIRLSQTSQPSP